jgi:hypothetical protein
MAVATVLVPMVLPAGWLLPAAQLLMAAVDLTAVS